ncbi:pentatricopeptide repeat-containing protein At3g53360, mitochondrial [Cryptomeria japonica]|uniref:pentatricopeptide repeat-containing protein At3g53360, mitochondrial n=1 Tax=Cryptomeria japonica TaxID=3369 RepID=UPI0025AB9E05|nr:pentatricopeptide repeat-containing protein At3g53360, mitochondrial [Cryptomeria japonica]
MPSIPHLTQNLRAFCREGRLKQAQHILLTIHNTSVYSSTYLHILPAFSAHKTFTEGQQIHSQINDRGYTFATNTFWQNRLINMYDKCGSLVDARQVFNHMNERDVFTWNMIIAGYQRNGIPWEAFTLFNQMQRTLVQPDHFTFSTLLPVCTNASSLKHGLQIHGRIIRCGFQFDVIVMNTLIDMYAKCGRMQRALELFDKMPKRDAVSFIAIISGFTQIGLAKQALGIFRQMQSGGIKPNSATFASIVSVCARMEALDQGREIHQKLIENGLLSNVVAVTALVDMYAKCGSIQKAQGLFDEMPQRDATSWNVMIGGYTHNGLVDEALGIYRQVQVAGVKPNSTIFASFLPACAQAEALEQGMEIHQKIIKCGFLSTVIVANALLDMYAKCGSIQKVTQLFDKMHQRDLASWNEIIVAHAQNRLFNKSLEFFRRMQLASIKSDSSTFASILTACTKLGVLVQGMQIHQKVIKTGFLSDVVVVTALIDIYAKCGSIQKAHELFDNMSSRDVASWNAIIVGYAQNGLVDKALDIFKQIQLAGLKPDSVTYASVLPAFAKIGALEQGSL